VSDQNGNPHVEAEPQGPPNPFELAWFLVDAAVRETRAAAESPQGIRIGHRIALAQMATSWAQACATLDLVRVQRLALGLDAPPPKVDLLAGLDPSRLRARGQ
jgi:hypothetical protein